VLSSKAARKLRSITVRFGGKNHWKVLFVATIGEKCCRPMKDGGPGGWPFFARFDSPKEDGETREMREIKDGRKWRNK
jgi:hypothetical protein